MARKGKKSVTLTKEQAIEKLLYARQNADEDLQKEWCVALDMAMEALSLDIDEIEDKAYNEGYDAGWNA